MALSNLKHKCSHIVPFKSCTFLFGHNSRNGYYQLRIALKRLVGDKRATRSSTSVPPACTTVFCFERFGRHRLELHIFGEQSKILNSNEKFTMRQKFVLFFFASLFILPCRMFSKSLHSSKTSSANMACKILFICMNTFDVVL